MGFGRVKRKRDGSIAVLLHPEEREVLGEVLRQLREAMTSDTSDPMLHRLFPPAYPEDPEKEEGFRVLAGAELLESRLAAIDAVEASLHATRLDPDAAAAWMRSLNALRLVLGTNLDIRDDTDQGEHLDPEDPAAPAWVLYHFLSALVDDLVHALSG